MMVRLTGISKEEGAQLDTLHAHAVPHDLYKPAAAA